MKRGSIYPLKRKMGNKTTMSYYLSSIRMAKVNKFDNTVGRQVYKEVSIKLKIGAFESIKV